MWAINTNDEIIVCKVLKGYNIKADIDIILGWKEVTLLTQNSAWNKLLPECVHLFHEFGTNAPAMIFIEGTCGQILTLCHWAEFDR